jgi:hypothetical protein
VKLFHRQLVASGICASPSVQTLPPHHPERAGG